MGTVELNDVGVFVAVVEVESFSAAAVRLGLPKSSVSRAIARLEDAMGARMLHRTTRRVSVSTEGRALYEKVRADIASLRDAVTEVPGLEEEPSGTLRVTAPVDMSDYLADLIVRFTTRFRRVEVDVRLTNDYVDLVAAGIDVALRFATKRLKDSALKARKLAPAHMKLFASPAYLARRGTPRSPRDLDQHEWVVYRRVPRFTLESGSRSEEVTMRGRLTCDNLEFLRSALVKGAGIGYLSPVVADSEVAAGTLVPVLPAWFSPISNLWAVWPEGPRTPRKVSAFLDFVADTLKGRPMH